MFTGSLKAKAAEMNIGQRRHSLHFDLDVEVDKDKIIEVLKANREKHAGEFSKAFENYKLKALTDLEDRLDNFKDGGLTDGHITNLSFSLSPPENFVDTYDSVIGMIESSVENVIKLSRSNYVMFMEDRWDWSDHFRHLNSTYRA